MLFQCAHRTPRNQRVAVDTHELLGVALFQLVEAAIENVAPAGRTDGDVFKLGLEVQHFHQRYPFSPSAVLNNQAFFINFWLQTFCSLRKPLYFL